MSVTNNDHCGRKSLILNTKRKNIPRRSVTNWGQIEQNNKGIKVLLFFPKSKLKNPIKEGFFESDIWSHDKDAIFNFQI